MIVKVGFLINPIAGLGGKKAWKGTDKIPEAWTLYEQGERYSYSRVEKVLQQIPSDLPLHFYYCGEPMGQNLIERLSFPKTLVYNPPSKYTTAQDTKNACKEFVKNKVDIIIFVGGDGTARDITEVVKRDIPILGIPSGVKMFSGCFLQYPKNLVAMLKAMVEEQVDYAPEDILDVDEEAFRKDQVVAKLYDQAIVPHFSAIVQGSKISSQVSSTQSFEPIAVELKEELDIMKGLVVLGTGSTIYHVARYLGVEKTLLGIDVMIDGKIIAKDVDEVQLINLTKNKQVKLLVTPIGGQGFILGRGNQQLSAKVINNWDECELIVVATPTKIAKLKTLHIDVGDEITNNCIKKKYVKVLIGYHEYILKKLDMLSTN